MTKQAYVELNAKLSKKAEDLAAQDTIIRTEFARAFAWYEKTLYHTDTPKPRLPSWQEVFIEVGKLMAARTFYDFDGNIAELEYKAEELARKLDKLTNPPKQ
jgi:hypothetical protein